MDNSSTKQNEEKEQFPCEEDEHIGELDNSWSNMRRSTGSSSSIFPPQRHRSKSEADISCMYKHIHSLGRKRSPPDIRDLMAIDDIQELKTLLLFERQRSVQLENKVDALKKNQVRLSRIAEEEEEYLMNKLMMKLDKLKQEKEALATEVKEEEKHMTEVLQKKLDEVRHEKVDLENQLEQEQEYLVNKLRKQLAKVIEEKEKLAVAVEQEEEYLTNTLVKKMESVQKEKEELQRKLQHERTIVVAAMEKQLREVQQEKESLGAKLAKDSEDLLSLLQKALDRLHERQSSGDGSPVKEEDMLVEIQRRLTALHDLGKRSRTSSNASSFSYNGNPSTPGLGGVAGSPTAAASGANLARGIQLGSPTATAGVHPTMPAPISPSALLRSPPERVPKNLAT